MSSLRWGNVWAKRSGMARWTLAALVAGCAGLLGIQQAGAQITPRQLLGKSVSEKKTLEEYPDLENAVKRAENGDFDGARMKLNDAMKDHPKWPPAELILAKLMAAANQGGAARAELEKCVKNSPDDPEAYVVFGETALNERRFTDAGLNFGKAIQVAADFKGSENRKKDCLTRAEAGMATVGQAREDWAGAQQHLEAWIQQDPSNAAAHQQLGRALFKADTDENKANSLAKVKAEFAKAVDLDEKSIPPGIAIAQLFTEAKNLEMAEKYIDMEVTTQQKDDAAQLAVMLAAARWALDANKAEKALDFSDKAIAADKEKTALEAKFIKGVAARVLNKPDVAEQCLEEVYIASPSNFAASNQLALVLGEQTGGPDHKKKQEAGLELAKLNAQLYCQKDSPAAQQDPARNAEAASTLAWILFKVNPKDKKSQEVINAIEKTGNVPPDCLYYAAYIINEKDGDSDKALKLLDLSLKGNRFFVHREEAKELAASLRDQGADSHHKPKKEHKEDKPETSKTPDTGTGAGAGAGNGTPK